MTPCYVPHSGSSHLHWSRHEHAPRANACRRIGSTTATARPSIAVACLMNSWQFTHIWKLIVSSKAAAPHASRLANARSSACRCSDATCWLAEFAAGTRTAAREAPARTPSPRRRAPRALALARRPVGEARLLAVNHCRRLRHDAREAVVQYLWFPETRPARTSRGNGLDLCEVYTQAPRQVHRAKARPSSRAAPG